MTGGVNRFGLGLCFRFRFRALFDSRLANPLAQREPIELRLAAVGELVDDTPLRRELRESLRGT